MEDVALGILSDSLRDQCRETAETPVRNTLRVDLLGDEKQMLLSELVDQRPLHDVNMFLHTDYHRKKFPSAAKGKLKVRTEEDLNELAETLLNKPFLVDFQWEKVEVCFPARVYTAEGDALLYVNSQHPCVRNILRSGLEEAKQLMRQNKKFYLEFDFRSSISSYLCSKIQIQEDQDRLEDCRCGFGKITISNCRKYSPVFRFKDQTCPLWVICSPLCLLTFPCYMIYRKLACRDIRYNVKLNTKSIPSKVEAAILESHVDKGSGTDLIETTIIGNKIIGKRDSPQGSVRQRVKLWTHSVSGKDSQLSIDAKDKTMRIL